MAVGNAAIDTGGMPNGTTTKVFIVDDSFPVRERLVSMLARIKGVSVVGEAESPAFAIKGIVAANPDFVVLDLHLRGGSGIEILNAVTTVLPNVVFIVLTNYPNPHYRKACLKAGASYFLDKTSEFEKVLEIVSALGAARHKRSIESTVGETS